MTEVNGHRRRTESCGFNLVPALVMPDACEHCMEYGDLIRQFEETGMAESELEAVRTKICPKCKRELGRDQFYRHSGNPDGLNYWCKSCSKTASAKTASAKAASAKTETPPALPPNLVLTVDLTQHTDICETIRIIADREDRTIELQVRNILRRFVESIEDS